jgi:hypothetical protein
MGGRWVARGSNYGINHQVESPQAGIFFVDEGDCADGGGPITYPSAPPPRVIEFFQTQINAKMTIAAERLAVIAAVTLPITALSSVVGMNVIANDRSDPVLLAILLLIILTMSVVLLVWAKRRGWW